MTAPTRMTPNRAALLGLGLLLPFMVLNIIGANKIEPYIFWLQADGHLKLVGKVAVIGSIILIGAGAVIAGRPVMTLREKSLQKIPYTNLVIAIILAAIFMLMVIGFAEEIYRCDFLNTPNCD